MHAKLVSSHIPLLLTHPNFFFCRVLALLFDAVFQANAWTQTCDSRRIDCGPYRISMPERQDSGWSNTATQTTGGQFHAMDADASRGCFYVHGTSARPATTCTAAALSRAALLCTADAAGARAQLLV